MNVRLTDSEIGFLFGSRKSGTKMVHVPVFSFCVCVLKPISFWKIGVSIAWFLRPNIRGLNLTIFTVSRARIRWWCFRDCPFRFADLSTHGKGILKKVIKLEGWTITLQEIKLGLICPIKKAFKSSKFIIFTFLSQDSVPLRSPS